MRTIGATFAGTCKKSMNDYAVDINPRHFHPAAITFHILSGIGIWQEEGESPVILHAGDSLLVPAGTTHAHWNPSATEKLRFLEFIVSEKDKGRAIPRPLKD